MGRACSVRMVSIDGAGFWIGAELPADRWIVADGTDSIPAAVRHREAWHGTGAFLWLKSSMWWWPGRVTTAWSPPPIWRRPAIAVWCWKAERYSAAMS